MSHTESGPENLQHMSLEAMQESLLAAGWTHPDAGHPEQGFGGFYREYPRVNALLQGAEYVLRIFELSEVVAQRAPWLVTGMGVGRWSTETEVGVEVSGRFNEIQDATQAMVADRYLREAGFEAIEDDRLQDWLIMKGEPGQPRPGTVAFFEQSERAVAIRALTIPFIRDYKAMVLGEGIRDESVQRLLDANQALAALGVRHRMHEDARPVAFMDPVVRAVRTTLMDGVGLSGGARARLQEHDLTGGEAPVIALGSDAEPEALLQGVLLQRLDGMLEQLGASDDTKSA